MAELNKFGEISVNGVCPECGKPIKAEWIVCPYCRTKLSEETKVTVCPKCGKQVAFDWKACPACAANLEKTPKNKKKKKKVTYSPLGVPSKIGPCPVCGEKVAAGYRILYCYKCGAYVHGSCAKHIAREIFKCPKCKKKVSDMPRLMELYRSIIKK